MGVTAGSLPGNLAVSGPQTAMAASNFFSARKLSPT